MKKINRKISVIGCGNIGGSIVSGLLDSGLVSSSKLFLTKRNLKTINNFKNIGCDVSSDNLRAVKSSSIVMLTVTPQKIGRILGEIKDSLDPKKHIIISV